MAYVDGFVIPLPKKNVKAYQRMSKAAGKVWMKHGALEYRECVGDDLKSKMGVSFPKLARTKTGEAVLFSWIVYRSRRHRDSVNAKVMKDKKIAAMMNEMKGKHPFDPKRMTYGGFKTIVDL